VPCRVHSAARVVEFSRFSPDWTCDLRPNICSFRPSSNCATGPGGLSKRCNGQDFERGVARSVLELGKNIRERKPLVKKSPTLTVVESASKRNPLAPPPGLGEAGARLWKSVHDDFEITDAGGLAMLHQICSAADRVAEYAATIARDGTTVRTASGLKDHPLLRHELAAQSFIVRSLHRLGLDIVSPRHEVGRPAGAYRGEPR